jgi:hypothetical protein
MMRHFRLKHSNINLSRKKQNNRHNEDNINDPRVEVIENPPVSNIVVSTK